MSPADSQNERFAPAVAAPVLQWLRIEGLAVVGLATLVYARSGASWWLFAALWLAPDLSMLGYSTGPRFGSYCYNAVHSYIGPIGLAVVAILLHRMELLPFAYIWFHHIGLDRMLGYGLKYPHGFGLSHLKGPRRSLKPL
jgi:hypothetical protein